MGRYNIFVILLLFNFAYSFPANDANTEKSTLIATTDDVQSDGPSKQDKVEKPLPPIELRKMNVNSIVKNRYANTTISTYYANPADKAQEATFTVVLPDTAFISGFIMEIKGKQYKAYVEEKKKAKQTYDEAVSSGVGAAHVAADARDSNRFTVSMNVEPNSKVIFNLTYEQLLVRKHDKYDMVINLHPGQLVKDLTIDVYLHESRPLVDVRVPQLRSGNEITENDNKKDNDYAKVDIKDKTNAHIHFAPSIEQQKEMALLLNKDKSADQGIAGQFIVEYDVERDPQGGEVIISSDGYFVHFFSPNELKPIPKHVVFVLDVSGSMYGRKLEQVKEAMQIILDQLSPQDYFNLVEFSDDALVWNLENKLQSPSYSTENIYWHPRPQEENKNKTLPPAYQINEKNLKAAKEIVKDMETKGGTNIFDALITGVKIANTGVPIKDPPKPIIIFLTDGQANVGETNLEKIMQAFAEGNGRYKATLFTLAFGDDADKEFLKKISLKNNGFMRGIYEAADASLQLQDFYKTISSPLLLNVKFNDSAIDKKSVTKNGFDTLYKGGELVVAGKLSNAEATPDLFKVHGFTYDGTIDFIPKIIRLKPVPTEIGEMEKLWAYMTIRQLLDEATAKDQKESPEKQKALDLSLKYSFVTPVTSLVVVKPNETKAVETEEAKAKPEYPQFALAGLPGPPGLGFGGSINSFPLSASAVAYAPASGVSSLVGGSSFQFGGPLSTTRLPFTSNRPVHTKFPGLLPQEHLDVSEENIAPTKVDGSHDEVDNKIINILPWIKSLIHVENGTELLTINNKKYHIGNNETVVESKSCKVTSSGASGNCTLLSACPAVYPKLTDLKAYEQYLCTLNGDKYAGVCCIKQD